MDRHRTYVSPLSTVRRICANRGVDVLRGVAFWTAIALTLAYLPIFAMLSTPLSIEQYTAIIGLHAVTLVVGHDYSGV